MNYKNILERLDFWMKQSDKWQKATDEYCKTIAPSSYSPLIEDSYTRAFIDGVCHSNPELKEALEDYAYEPSCVVTYKNKEYRVTNIDEYAEYLELINK